jgi:multidrug efflux pump subunit AcrA (membrane-fusion protein)
VTALSGIAGRLPRVKRPAFGFLNVLLAGALGVLGFGAYLAMRTTTASTQGAVRTAPVSRGVVLSSVSAAGSVQPASQVGLDFETSGRLNQVNIAVGQHVRGGQILGRLDATDAKAALQEALANLATAEANLQQTLAGETPEQRASDALSVQQSNMQVSTAKTALVNAQQQLQQDARTTAQSVKSAGQSSTLTQATEQLRTDRGNERGAVAKLKADRAQLTFNGTTYSTAAEAVGVATNVVRSDQAKQQADQQANLTLQMQQTIDNQKLTADRASLSAAQASGIPSAIATWSATVVQDENPVNNDALSLAQLQQTIQADGFQLSQDQSALSTLTGLQGTINGDQTSITGLETKIVADGNAITSAKAATANAVSAAKSTQSVTLSKDRQAVQSARQQLASARLGVKTASASNAVKQAPPQSATLMQQRAAILQSQTTVDTARRTLAQTTLRAPEAGLIAALNGSVGAQVSGGGSSSSSAASSSSSSSSTAAAGTGSSSTGSSSSSSAFVTLLGRGMQVSAAFSESDAAKVRVGQPATVTVSALPNEQLAAHVVSVGIVSSSSSGVVQYAVVFALDRTEPLLKSGMSANVSVTVAERDNVLNVPSATVTGSGAAARVTVVTGGVQKTVQVVAGLKGDTTTEIVSGVTAGQQVVTSTGATLFSAGTGTSTTARPRFGGGGFGGGPLGGGFGGGG